MRADTEPESRTAAIRRLARSDPPAATALLRQLLADRFGLAAEGIVLTADRYALNSLSGVFAAGGTGYFFKFHQEEGEAAMGGEYYRARLLADAGLPVDRPLFVSAEPGEQVLVYARRDTPRFADVLRALDLAPDPEGMASALVAEARLCADLLAVYRRTLRAVTPAEVAAEPIHRLFHARLTDAAEGGRRYPGGRLAGFYLGRRVALPGATLDWADLAARRWRINGVTHAEPLAALFDAAAGRLAPERLADAGGVTAHADAHAANLWVEPGAEGPRLTLYDPAFAGAAVPTLLAEIKPTFHNVLAHPLWLYDPDEAAARYRVRLRLAPGLVEVETDCTPTPVRRALLRVKAEALWRPLLAELAGRGMLPADWRRVVRLGLFLCPTLVMNLCAGRDPAATAIGLAAAVAAGSPPEAGDDLVATFLDAIDPAHEAGAARAEAISAETP